jgi:hypothetical protein
MLPPGDVGYSMSVARGPLLDEAWHRVQELPARLAATEVASAWEFQGSAAEWARAVDLAPPPDSGA